MLQFLEIIRAFTNELPMKPAPPVMSTLRITWTMRVVPTQYPNWNLDT